ncbi:unnamed protein product [Rhizophagus irregularis]|nr:unnamed protein product [Rhizophagus irregularis]
MSQPHRAIKDTICSCFYPTVLFVEAFSFFLLWKSVGFFFVVKAELNANFVSEGVSSFFSLWQSVGFFSLWKSKFNAIFYWYLLRSFYWQFGFFVVEALEFFRCGS